MEVERLSRDITREFKNLMQENKIFPVNRGSAHSERFGPEYEGGLTTSKTKNWGGSLEKAQSVSNFSEGSSPRKMSTDKSSYFMKEEDLDSYFKFLDTFQRDFLPVCGTPEALQQFLDTFLLALKSAQVRNNFLQTRAA